MEETDLREALSVAVNRLQFPRTILEAILRGRKISKEILEESLESIDMIAKGLKEIELNNRKKEESFG